MFGLRERNPDLVMMIQAAAIGVVIFLPTALAAPLELTRDQDSLALRIVFGVAFACLMFDVIETAFIERMKATRLNAPWVWIYGFYMAYFWAVLMILMSWEGIERAAPLMLIWGGAGAFFGLWMTLSPPRRAPLTHLYDLEKPFTATAAGRVMYFAWPFVIVALMASMVLFPPDDGLRDGYFLFQLVFTGSLMTLYFRRPQRGAFLAGLPRALGIFALLFGLIWLAPTA